MDVTIRFDGATKEYGARDTTGKLVGSCYWLAEHGGGVWKWEVKEGVAGIHSERETALLHLHRACVAKVTEAKLKQFSFPDRATGPVKVDVFA